MRSFIKFTRDWSKKTISELFFRSADRDLDESVKQLIKTLTSSLGFFAKGRRQPVQWRNENQFNPIFTGFMCKFHFYPSICIYVRVCCVYEVRLKYSLHATKMWSSLCMEIPIKALRWIGISFIITTVIEHEII